MASVSLAEILDEKMRGADLGMMNAAKGDIRYACAASFLGAIVWYTDLMVFKRRLARRGGVKRINGFIYQDVRNAMKDRLELVGHGQTRWAFQTILIACVLDNQRLCGICGIS